MMMLKKISEMINVKELLEKHDVDIIEDFTGNLTLGNDLAILKIYPKTDYDLLEQCKQKNEMIRDVSKIKCELRVRTYDVDYKDTFKLVEVLVKLNLIRHEIDSKEYVVYFDGTNIDLL